MVEWLWRAFARALARCPRVVEWLLGCARRRPYFHLPGYMDRWWLVPPGWHLPFTIRFHRILRADNERDMHDHPWAFRTMLLEGWYVEERHGVVRRLSAGMTATCDLGEFHRISQVSDGGVLTLVVLRAKGSSWGFLTPEGWVHWRKYSASEWEAEAYARTLSNGGIGEAESGQKAS
jgi:hypothetical protein